MKKSIYILLICCAAIASVNAQDVQKNINGTLCKIVSPNSGEKIKLNDVITFNVSQTTENDSVLFSTYLIGQPVKVQVHPSSNPGDLMDVFQQLTANDSAVVKVPVDSVFKGHEDAMPSFLSKGSNLLFKLKIEKVQTLEEAINERNAETEKYKAAQTALGDAYIKSHSLVVQTTPSGLKYAVIKKGPGPKPVAGDTVEVNYTGRTAEGKVFDSSIESVAKQAGLEQPGRTYEPIKFVVGQQEVIKGWDEGLLLLNGGSKATFIIPSDLAYGERGAGEDIAPYSTLVFDVELIKVIKPGKAAVKAVAKPIVKPAVKSKTPAKKRTPVKTKN
ncbi:FKBP-type peptidyl-prolyl cis-trans isomerase [Mucilaginibacter segetis]|uniref:peptidylprolyl isomerase n=1 Tax=Mucilaginibacter segetis TaxID=2793071 RepID=A0A934PPR3_9SPHI|nr:FKBP-type peptidyl-prolyl cis-trans isomerase [Mucilaginibacter segetis]MBK0377834.1 FKBP-type peptidyl-prolyl cis-trans isomerase [Mucilaginibacter segetis]